MLSEDLRIEIASIVQRHMPELDVLDPAEDHPDEPPKVGAYRRHYFLRRSFATIREFAECLGDLRECAEFQVVRDQDPEFARILDESVQFFSSNEQLLRTVRNNTGGHFGYRSAQYAVRNLDTAATGKLEFEIDGHNVNAKLHFSGELAATAFCHGLPGKTNEEKIANAIQRVGEAYRHATGVVQVMIAADLMHRFG